MKAPREMDLYGRSIPAGTEIVLSKEPWMRAEYRESYLNFLNGILTLDSEVLEFESGSSSIYMAKRVKHLMTFERSEVWYKIMQEEIAKEGITNITIRLDPNYADTFHCANPCFDVAIVDNWIKGSPEKHIRIAMDCLRTGGYLLFHKGDE
ncbi:hypothetical protein KA005_82065, partial [bacterium]|nr:hypothetical protein [bacterium]